MKSTIKFALILIMCMSCQAQKSNNNGIEQKIENYLEQLEKDQFHGSVLVAHKGEILVSKGYGFSNKESSLKNSNNTVFDIGSITKQFTAAGILKLEEQGKLSTIDKISKYFTDVPANKKDITLHQLLTHSSGFRPALGHDYHSILKEDFLKKAFDSESLFSAGSQYEYSNVGYTLLAMIIEEVSGMSYEAFLYNNLWKPAKMQLTGYQRPNYDQDNVAVGYKKSGKWGKPNEKWDSDVSWHLKGNGGILSTTGDMYKWHRALLGNGVLSETSKSKMYSKHIREGEDAQSYYGYGWAIFPTSRNTELIAHNGGNGIFFADFWRYLEEDVTIMVMTNQANRGYDELALQLARIILDPDHKPNAELRISESEAKFQRQIEGILDGFLEVIKRNDETAWKDFIEGNGSKEFIGFVSMKEHLAVFRKMHEKLKDQNANGVTISEGELKITFDNNILVMNTEQTKNENVKIGGMMLE